MLPGTVPSNPITPTLPHTAPFRLVDRIVSADVAAGCLVAERRLTVNDALWPAESQSSPYFFSSTRSGTGARTPSLTEPAAPPAFPPTLIIEALCQAAACLNSLTLAPAGVAAPQQHHGLLVAIRDFKFPAFAYVGETLTLKVQQKEKLGQVIAFAVCATVVTALPAPTAAPELPAAAPELPAAAPDLTDLAQPREVASGRLLFAVTGA